MSYTRQNTFGTLGKRVTPAEEGTIVIKVDGLIMAIFENWFTTIALPYLKRRSGPKILIRDNLSSHVSLKVRRECEKCDVNLIMLPPNRTHILQHLNDRPVKKAWREVLNDWKSTRDPVSKDAFPSLLAEILNKIEVKK